MKKKLFWPWWIKYTLTLIIFRFLLVEYLRSYLAKPELVDGRTALQDEAAFQSEVLVQLEAPCSAKHFEISALSSSEAADMAVGIVSVDRYPKENYLNITLQSILAAHGASLLPTTIFVSSTKLSHATGGSVEHTRKPSRQFCDQLEVMMSRAGENVRAQRIRNERHLSRVQESGSTNCPQAAYTQGDYANSCVHSSYMAETLDYVAAIATLCSNGNDGVQPKMALLLEDDVAASRDWLRGLLHFLQKRAAPNWNIISLYVPDMAGITDVMLKVDSTIDASRYDLPCCTQAMLFRCDARTTRLVAALTRHAHRAPKDHLLDRYSRKLKMVTLVHVPHLFQHVGTRSSLGTRPLHQSGLFSDDHPSGLRVLFILHTSGEPYLTAAQQRIILSASRIFAFDLSHDQEHMTYNEKKITPPAFRIAVLSNSLQPRNFSILSSKMQLSLSPTITSIRLERIDNVSILRGTPLEEWYQRHTRSEGNLLTSSINGNSEASLSGSIAIALQLALLYVHGGAYINLDTMSSPIVAVKPRPTWPFPAHIHGFVSAKQFPMAGALRPVLENSILMFRRHSIFLFHIMKDVVNKGREDPTKPLTNEVISKLLTQRYLHRMDSPLSSSSSIVPLQIQKIQNPKDT